MEKLETITLFAEENGFSLRYEEEDNINDIFEKKVSRSDGIYITEIIYWHADRIELSFLFSIKTLLKGNTCLYECESIVKEEEDIDIIGWFELQYGFKNKKHTMRNLKNGLEDNRKLGNVLISFFLKVFELGYFPAMYHATRSEFKDGSVYELRDQLLVRLGENNYKNMIAIGANYYNVGMTYNRFASKESHSEWIKRKHFAKLSETEILEILLSKINKKLECEKDKNAII